MDEYDLHERGVGVDRLQDMFCVCSDSEIMLSMEDGLSELVSHYRDEAQTEILEGELEWVAGGYQSHIWQTIAAQIQR